MLRISALQNSIPVYGCRILPYLVVIISIPSHLQNHIHAEAKLDLKIMPLARLRCSLASTRSFVTSYVPAPGVKALQHVVLCNEISTEIPFHSLADLRASKLLLVSSQHNYMQSLLSTKGILVARTYSPKCNRFYLDKTLFLKSFFK